MLFSFDSSIHVTELYRMNVSFLGLQFVIVKSTTFDSSRSISAVSHTQFTKPYMKTDVAGNLRELTPRILSPWKIGIQHKWLLHGQA